MLQLWQFFGDNYYQIVDTLIVAVLLYYLFLYTKGTRTAILLQALILLTLLYFLCQYLKLITLVFLLERMLLIGPLAAIVIFAPEIRSLLERMSRHSRIFGWLAPGETDNLQDFDIEEAIADTAEELSERRVGALIVFERSEPVDRHVVPGARLDAVCTQRLLVSLFERHNPLHDGAVLIRGERLHSAGNFLPLPEQAMREHNLGTRHRAALGLAERCDALVLVVSEQSGDISIAFHGRLAIGLDKVQLVEQLRAILQPNENYASIVPRPVYN